MPYATIPDLKEELVNAAINIQTIVNILTRKGIIVSEHEWEDARYEATVQLQGKYGYPPPLPPSLRMPG